MTHNVSVHMTLDIAKATTTQQVSGTSCMNRGTFGFCSSCTSLQMSMASCATKFARRCLPAAGMVRLTASECLHAYSPLLRSSGIPQHEKQACSSKKHCTELPKTMQTAKHDQGRSYDNKLPLHGHHKKQGGHMADAPQSHLRVPSAAQGRSSLQIVGTLSRWCPG